jgi:hypothetical protein
MTPFYPRISFESDDEINNDADKKRMNSMRNLKQMALIQN